MLEKTVLIRADASPSIGMGHRVRCQILADELSKKSWTVRFVCHASCRSLSNENDIIIEDETRFLTLAATANLVILDHYAYDSALIERLYQYQPNLLLLDDMNDRGALFCRWLLNPVALDYRVNLASLMRKYEQTCILFTGIQYALLRRQFTVDLCDPNTSSEKNITKMSPKPREKLLVTMGGTDPLELTLPFLMTLNAMGFDGNNVVVMLGSQAKKSADVIEYCQQHNIDVQQDVTDVARLMSQAKMAISAGGSTLFELAFVGVPSLFLQIAENQTRLLEAHRNSGWCKVYRLDYQNLDDRRKMINKVCQQLLLDWEDDVYLSRADSVLSALKVGLKSNSISIQLEVAF